MLKDMWYLLCCRYRLYWGNVGSHRPHMWWNQIYAVRHPLLYCCRHPTIQDKCSVQQAPRVAIQQFIYQDVKQAAGTCHWRNLVNIVRSNLILIQSEFEDHLVCRPRLSISCPSHWWYVMRVALGTTSTMGFRIPHFLLDCRSQSPQWCSFSVKYVFKAEDALQSC